jgi:coenzyme PQQ precursor peptide PqqA
MIACGRLENTRPTVKTEMAMKWTTPEIVEICVGLEINSYACADL